MTGKGWYSLDMNLIDYINNGKPQLDISIRSASKYLSSEKRIINFLTTDVKIEHKTDGVKLTVLKESENSFIFAYKGNVLYKSEYDYLPNIRIKNESIGASQFKAVFKHFKAQQHDSIPVGTELLIEFLMRKPTLSSNYSTVHKMVLIGYSKSSWVEGFGKLKTSSSGFNTDKRNQYAKALKIDTPQELFKGVLGSELQFSQGILNNTLKNEFLKVKSALNWNNPNLLIEDIKQLFLSVGSKYGGVEEGVVIKTPSTILKWQQPFQLDQVARHLNKMKYREPKHEDESKYWENVKFSALKLSSSIVVSTRRLEDVLGELSLDLKKLKLSFSHSKKTPTNIKDDIQLNAKKLLIKKMKGNNNALIVGKFRLLTNNGHVKLIKRALSLYDNVVVCIVTSSANKDTMSIREKQMKLVFPNVVIIHAMNGNLIRIMDKSPININAIYAGSDRVGSYKTQLKNNVGVSVKELPRTDSDISASKVIDNILNKSYFKKSSPKQIHQLYDELINVYTG